MRILVVCGAGASSTFVAMRLRHAAQAQGLSLQSFAGTEASLPVDLDCADLLLVGPHLKASIDDIRARALLHGVPTILLPEDVFTDLDGVRTLSLVEPALTEGDAAAAAGA